MLAKVTCVSCGNQKKIAKVRAGEFFPCDLCGGVMPVPSYHGKPDPFVRVTYAPPSIFQRLAAIFGFFAGLAGFAGGGIIIFSGAGASSDAARPETAYLTGGALVAVAAAFIIAGLIYFFAGLNIRDNGAVSAIVVLVFGPLHALTLAGNMFTVMTLQKTGGTSTTLLKTALFYDSTSVSLLLIFLLCTIFSLATQDGLLRVGASRYFTLFCVYGFLIFAALVAYQGFAIMGHPLAIQLPPAMMKDLAAFSAICLGVALLNWLISFAVARTHIFGGIVGLLAALPPVAIAGWFLYRNAPGIMARHDINGYITLGAVGFIALLVICPSLLLICSLCTPAPKGPAPEVERPIERFAFDV